MIRIKVIEWHDIYEKLPTDNARIVVRYKYCNYDHLFIDVIFTKDFRLYINTQKEDERIEYCWCYYDETKDLSIEKKI